MVAVDALPRPHSFYFLHGNLRAFCCNGSRSDDHETATEEAAPTAASSGGTGRVIPTRRRRGGLVVLSDLGGGRDPLRPMEVTHVDAHLDLAEFSVIYQSANFNWIVPSETH